MESYNIWSFFGQASFISINVLRFIHVVLYVNSLLLNNTPLCGCTTLYLSIHQWMEIWIVSPFWPLWKCCYEYSYINLCVDMCFNLSGRFIGVELLGCMVSLCSVFQEQPNFVISIVCCWGLLCLFLWCLCLVLVWGSCWPQKELGSVLSFLEEFVKYSCYFFFKCLVEFTSEAMWARFFLCD